jgi:hypothetical protein
MAKAGNLSTRAAVIGFEAAVREAGAKTEATDFFPINLQSMFSFAPLKAIPETATPANAIYSEDFFVRAFSLGKNQVSPPIALDDQVIVLQLKAERQLPDTTMNLVGNWVGYVASQTAQGDLTELLMAPGKLKDNFVEAFSQFFIPRRR